MTIERGASAEIRVEGSLGRDGKWLIPLTYQLATAAGYPAGEGRFPLCFQVRQGKYNPGTFARIFAEPALTDPEMGPLFRASAWQAGLQKAPDYDPKRPTAEALASASLRLPDLKTGRGGVLEDLDSSQGGAARAVSAQGVFSCRGSDGLAHAAWGWKVEAFARVGGRWRKLATTSVKGDGIWTVSVPYDSGTLRFVASPMNRYFHLRGEGGDYAFVLADYTSVPSSVNVGEQFLDSWTTLPNLGDTYDRAMALWWRLLFDARVNPLRGESIRIVFPNTRDDCGSGSGSGIPWACSKRDEFRIVLDAGNAMIRDTVIHELGHQLEAKHWDDQGPGGSHTLTGCFSRKLVLSEGYATFLALWLFNARDARRAMAYGIDHEAPGAGTCASPLDSNEVWIAAALWDLYDTHMDGFDGLYVKDRGLTLATPLVAAEQPNLAHFHRYFRNFAEEGRTEPADVNGVNYIFTQNKIRALVR